ALFHRGPGMRGDDQVEIVQRAKPQPWDRLLHLDRPPQLEQRLAAELTRALTASRIVAPKAPHRILRTQHHANRGVVLRDSSECFDRSFVSRFKQNKSSDQRDAFETATLVSATVEVSGVVGTLQSVIPNESEHSESSSDILRQERQDFCF